MEPNAIDVSSVMRERLSKAFWIEAFHKMRCHALPQQLKHQAIWGVNV
jgi:hypothetical protein